MGGGALPRHRFVGLRPSHWPPGTRPGGHQVRLSPGHQRLQRQLRDFNPLLLSLLAFALERIFPHWVCSSLVYFSWGFGLCSLFPFIWPELLCQ